MTDYMHHVPGRLRIRARTFRCASTQRSQALRRLRSQSGVRDVRLNQKAGSVTLHYDPEVTSARTLLAFIHAECLETAPARPATATIKRRSAPAPRPLAAEIGRMALSVLVNKGVSYSLSSLLGART